MGNESPGRAKEEGYFLLYRPCQGSGYGNCLTPGCARSYLSSGLPGQLQII